MFKEKMAPGPADRAKSPELVLGAQGTEQAVWCGVLVIAGTHQSFFLVLSGFAALSSVSLDPVALGFWLL